MIYGNHNKKKGDIVQIARWDDAEMANLKFRFQAKFKDPGEIRFIIYAVDYYARAVLLKMEKTGVNWAVSLDATNLIKVGQIY